MNRRVMCLLCLVLAASWGCAQLLGGRAEIRDRRKFLIESQPLQINLPHSERPYPMSVQIDRFSVSRLYERNQIIFRLTPEEIEDDPNNQWAVRPGEMITTAVTDYLRGANLFTDVRETFLTRTPDLTLTGTVDAIERYDSSDRWFARLDVTMQLVDRENRIFWQYSFDPDEIEVFDSDMVYTVQALRGLLQRNMETAIRGLDRALLIRKASGEGRDLSTLLEGNGETVAEARADTAQIPLETDDYRIIPGKLVPRSP